MKKVIKIFALILFILFVFGITTSKALTVNTNTSKEDLVTAIENGEELYLSGNSYSIMRNNPWIFCRQKGASLGGYSSRYHLDTQDGGKVTYPEADKDYGYAIAYILAYGKEAGYNKYDIQCAYWKILTKTPGYNGASTGFTMSTAATKLYNLGVKYQEFKKAEDKLDKPFKVNTNKAETITSGNTLIYGPIEVDYVYVKSGYTGVSFGGFDFSFSGTGVTKTNVQLCTKTASGYTNIDTDNDGKIRKAGYKELYVSIDLNEVKDSKINMNIKYNEINASAVVYKIEGTSDLTGSTIVHCMECNEKMSNAKEITEGNAQQYVADKTIVGIYNEEYWVYSEKTDLGNSTYSSVNGSYYYGKYVFGNNSIKSSVANTLYSYICTYHSPSTIGPSRYTYSYAHDDMINHINQTNLHDPTFIGGNYTKISAFVPARTEYHFKKFSGCSADVEIGGSIVKCGSVYEYNSRSKTQDLIVLSITKYEEKSTQLHLEIPLTTSIEITKEWEDYNNQYNLRPEEIDFNVFRSTDNRNWTKLTKNTDYKVEVQDNEGEEWKILISNLLIADSQGNKYTFKVEEQELNYYAASYNPEGKNPRYDGTNYGKGYLTITNNLKKIDISGYVWLDGQTGIKPAVTHNGVMDNSETRMENIVVYLYYKNPETGRATKIEETKTDANGYYKFENYEIGYYYVKFEYDGINYEDTISVQNGSSKAFETDSERSTFNNKFKTITYEKSNDGTRLNYNYSDRKSTLITTENGRVIKDFQMFANTRQVLYKTDTNNINLGLVKRGMDIALSTDVYDAKVTVNGQTTEYTFNKENESEIVIGGKQTNEEVSYNLNLYASDYNYRIRDYVSNDGFKENDYINKEESTGIKTGDELKVYVTYELNLQNQSTKTTKINEVKYKYDSNYSFIGFTDNSNIDKVQNVENELTITLKNLELTDGTTGKLYLVFEVNNNNGLILGNFSNRAEITSYSTDEGLIDVDSQPGNCSNSNHHEDDCDTAGGLTIKVIENTVRKLTGKVFDNNNNKNVNDVIVQLVELKTVNGKVYEYIWQETVSGSGEGLRLTADGADLEEYTYEIKDGSYEFIGFIPGDYIVRFIYGDGIKYKNVLFGDMDSNGIVNADDAVYLLLNVMFGDRDYPLEQIAKMNADINMDGVLNTNDAVDLLMYILLKGEMTEEEREELEDTFGDLDNYTEGVENLAKLFENTVKYNGQDYKSVSDVNYNKEWYNSSAYAQGASVARDNEARRLETMAYSVEIDAEKGVLLKLLNNVSIDDLNETEKEIIISAYNKKYDPDVTTVKNEVIYKLLADEVLKNTWMCAETSKIKVAVDTQNLSNTNTLTTVDGLITTYESKISDINFGLELRPSTKIELEKYITGFKLIASDGTTLVNAYLDINEYLDDGKADANKVQGIKDNVTILDTVWQYEVAPTEINTIVDGASLEFEYTLVVKNTGDTDYLSKYLADAYKDKTITEYATLLTNKAKEMKDYMKAGTYRSQIGNVVGNSYYVGGTGTGTVLTEITNIRDYVNNDLTFITSGGDVEVDKDAPHTYRILRDDYTMQEATINTILKTTKATGKMDNDGKAVIYKVTLGKKPISATGNLNFENYIAEVMSYTNAAGRRAITSTPGNAEIIDHEYRAGKTHEIDEADTARIQIGAATGEDEKTNYIIITAVIAGILVIAAGAVIVKKYVIK